MQEQLMKCQTWLQVCRAKRSKIRDTLKAYIIFFFLFLALFSRVKACSSRYILNIYVEEFRKGGSKELNQMC